MNRRGFLKALGIGGAVSVAASSASLGASPRSDACATCSFYFKRENADHSGNDGRPLSYGECRRYMKAEAGVKDHRFVWSDAHCDEWSI